MLRDGGCWHGIGPEMMPGVAGDRLQQGQGLRDVVPAQAHRQAQFEQSMVVLAAPIATAAVDREAVPDAGLKGALRDLGKSIGIARDEGEDAKARAAGFDDYLTKPIDFERLLALVQRCGPSRGHAPTGPASAG